ncbi:hypothetical protein EDE15_4352 [Edaphobacter aggregans]|uniref:Uncharacterized protein n=1 Tax=Edaphobacter aggregans TaxID=570835 RepID=A0A3R9NWY2_9BACT|nr:hypothetical protein [Edaphobacter aggregans]RSL18750.1 hypothetical protein EDE15_4352 [Edaphobacter aggregans]
MPNCARANSRHLCGAYGHNLGVFLLVSIFCTSHVFGQPTKPQLVIDSVNVRQEGVVSFSTLALGPDSRADCPVPQFTVAQTDDQAFRLCIDMASIQQVRFNAFTLTAYLVSAKGTAREAYKYQITGNPAGSFRDSPVRVSFHVKIDSNTFPGSILMPVYNAAAADLLTVEKQNEPAYVSVSGTTPLQIHLGNVADTLPIAVTDVTVSEDCPRCWTRIASSVSEKNPLTVDPGTSANLLLNLSPNTIPALMQGALAIKTDVPHDTLSLILTYHTVPGGSDRRQTVLVKVRFGPGLIGLGLALCGGIALGLLAKYQLTGKLGKQDERALHAILTALVLGVIAEFVGIMLTAYGNSRLVIFGLDIDPRQLFPAFILAILVSGGAAVVSWIKELFGKTS